MRSLIRASISCVAMLATLGPGLPVRAHEGQYRGPLDELRVAFRGRNPRLRPTGPVVTPPDGTPGSGGGGGGGIPRRRVPPVGEDGQGYLRWEFWWEHNKDLYLGLRNYGNREAAAVVGGADYLLGGAARDRIPVVEPLDDALRRSRVVPALRKGTRDSDPDVRAASWIALGKVGGELDPTEFRRGTTDSNPDVRKAAFLGLGILGRTEGIPMLVRGLRDEGEALRARMAAAIALGLLDAPEATPLLVNYLGTHVGRPGRNAEEVNVAVLIALGVRGDPAAAGPLADLVDRRGSASDRIRAFAVGALGRLGDRGSAPLLLRALRVRDLGIRRAAALALGEIGFRSAAGEELARLVARRGAWDREGSVTEEALAELDTRIERADKAARAERTELRRTRDGIARSLVRAIREDNDVQVRNYACISLGKNRGAGARETLLWALNTGYSASLHGFAALGLGLLGDPSVSPALLARLGARDNENLRGSYAIALGLLHESAAIPALTSIVLYQGLDSDLRGYAAIALGLLGDRDVTPDLQRILEGEKNDQDLIRGFSLALGLVGDRGSVETLRRVLRGSSNTRQARGAACIALGMIRDRDAVSPLTKLLTEARVDGRRVTSESRGFAAVGLGYLADRSVVPELSAIARNHDYRVFLQGFDDLLLVL